MISGDTLFYLSYGRTDLFGGSDNKMKKSLYRLSKEIDFCTKVFPGHERVDFELAIDQLKTMLTLKDDNAAKMELVFTGSIFYNVDIMNKLGVLCHADFR